MMIKIIEVKSELGAGTRGASLGIDAIKVAALNFKSYFFKQHSSIEIMHHNHLLLEDPSFADKLSATATMYEDISEEVSKMLKDNHFPVVLAGDHATAGGTIAGIKKAFPHDKIGIIWIDAHADLHSPYTTPSGNIHGMPIAVSLNEDNLSKKEYPISPDAFIQWERLKNILEVKPWVEPSHVVYVGLRDVEPQEKYLIEKYGMPHLSVDFLREKGAIETAATALSYLPDCQHIYISFDVDSLDCDLVSYGTGTPVPGGFTEEEMKAFIPALVKDARVCCLELTEVNPTLDNKGNKMAEAAFKVLEETVTVVQQRV